MRLARRTTMTGGQVTGGSGRGCGRRPGRNALGCGAAGMQSNLVPDSERVEVIVDRQQHAISQRGHIAPKALGLGNLLTTQALQLAVRHLFENAELVVHEPEPIIELTPERALSEHRVLNLLGDLAMTGAERRGGLPHLIDAGLILAKHLIFDKDLALLIIGGNLRDIVNDTPADRVVGYR